MSLSVPDLNFRVIAPALVVAATALLVLLGELATPAERKRYLGYLSIAGLLVAGLVAVSLSGPSLSAFRGMVVADAFGLFLTVVILAGAILSILLSIDFVHAQKIEQGEYYVLLLASVAGMIVMATATDLVIMFLGLELLSLPLYILAAFRRDNASSLEAGLKYFLLGAFSSAFFLYGVALIYGGTGTTQLDALAKAIAPVNAVNDMLLIGFGLLLAGFAFKVALVPFHWWTPDVYDGAPTAVTAFMSVAVKAAAFGAFFRVFLTVLPAPVIDWQTTLAVLAVLTMTLGNVTALVQSNIKRMLAYSSIAHAGYILIALVAGQSGASGALFYLLAYTVTNLGAFGAIIALSDGARERLDIADFAGAAREHPLVAAVMTICLLSLAGFPPFAGFIGKFLIFGAAVDKGWAWLAVIGVLNSLVSVYFYLRPVVQMYMNEPAAGWNTVRVAPLVAAALVLAVIGVVALGIFPSPVIAFAQIGLMR